MMRWIVGTMALGWGLVLGCDTEAQTRWIVGNTLIEDPASIRVADGRAGYGKGHGRGGGSPAPAPAVSAPAPAVSAPSGGEVGRADFQAPWSHGSVLIVPATVAQQQSLPQAAPAPTVAPCPECGQTQVLTVPLQLHLRASVQTVLGQAVSTQAAPSPCR